MKSVKAQTLREKQERMQKELKTRVFCEPSSFKLGLFSLSLSLPSLSSICFARSHAADGPLFIAPSKIKLEKTLNATHACYGHRFMAP